MSGIESLLVGRTLGGRYRIEEVIGRGGMGAVYRAIDERLGRQVALKVITVAGTGDDASRERLRARFFREARSAAALPHHPNVVPVYDFGSDEELGLDYLVMELLRGSDLASRLSVSGPPELSAALKILVEAARGVAVGHQQGLIHRDVKPGNIFLAQTPGREIQVRVVDFGIAKLADDEDTLAQLTQDGRVPHSPAYASPEQLRGLTQLTAASDVFSLGAVGFQLLTGERPFTESDRNRMSLGMPVDVPTLRTRNPAIPSPIEAVIQRALDFDPERRFSDAGQMAAALEQGVRGVAEQTIDPYVGGTPIATAVDGQDDDRTRVADIEDDRTLLAPAGSPGRPASRPTPRKPPPAAPRPPRRERSGIGGMLVWGLVLAVLLTAGLWAWSAWDSTARAGIDEVPEAPDSLSPVSPETSVDQPQPPTELDAFLANQDGVGHYSAGRYQEALTAFRRAVAISPDNPDYRRNFGRALWRLGMFEEAARELTRAIGLDPSRALPYANLAEVRLAQGDTAAAISSLEEYLDRDPEPASAASAERLLRDLRAAQEEDIPPLLGEAIEQEPLDPAPPDTAPAAPGGSAESPGR
ncbi:MAG: serine/threonine-protein kinase [Gemmatimonadota bacterium]